MKYPMLNELAVEREMIDVFAGYNHNIRIGEGEFYDMTNLSSDNYPTISPRSQRGVYANPLNPLGMVAKDALCYVDGYPDGGRFIINKYGQNDELNLGLTVEKDANGNYKPKTLISMGAYVIIMPDKKYINTTKYEDRGNIEAFFETTSTIIFDPCDAEGNVYLGIVSSDTAPENDKMWMDTTTNTIKTFSETTSSWTAVTNTYIKISSAVDSRLADTFEVGDGVIITGVNDIPDLESPTTAVIVSKHGEEKIGDRTIKSSIVVKGLLGKHTSQSFTESSPFKIERKMPDMDFIIEAGNRLWGCKYGLNANGVYVNEIYASKLGDFKNWNCFQGISTDSYVASVGTDGKFTGAITHLDYPLFFKENYVHKVYGNYPANFQIQTTPCRGVQDGCNRSLAIVNEVLYYKSRTGICAYDGSLPTEISSALGDVAYSDAVAGALGNKYYVSMKDSIGYNLFVYDTLKGMWHKEDNLQVMEFCNCRGDLYFIPKIPDKKDPIMTIKGSGTPETERIKWEAITGEIGTNSPDKKYISRMDVRMRIDVGTIVQFFVEYDSCGAWEHLFTMTGKALQSFAVPIKPKRCDHLRLKIIGNGDAKIFSICKTVEQGSDM